MALDIPDSEVQQNLAESMLSRDREAELGQPEVLSSLPVYKWETLASGLEKNGQLMLEMGKKNGESVFSFVGAGQDGAVFRMKLGDKDWAIKLYFARSFGAQGKEVIQQFCPEEKRITEVLFQNVSSDSDMELRHGRSMANSQAAGWYLGHLVEPNWVDAPVGLISLRGGIGGLIMPFIEGEPELPQRALMEAGSGLNSAIKRLARCGVGWDTMYDRPNIIKKNGEGWRLVDVDLSDREVLERDPRHLRPGEYYRAINKGEDRNSPFDCESYRYTSHYWGIGEIKSEMEILTVAHNEAKRGGVKGSFEEIADGLVIISNADEAEKIGQIAEKVHKVEKCLSRFGMSDLITVELCQLMGNGGLIVSWKKDGTENSLNLNQEGTGVEMNNFRYFKRNYIGGGGRVLVATKEKGVYRIRLSTYVKELNRDKNWLVGGNNGWEEMANQWNFTEAITLIRNTDANNEDQVEEMMKKILI